MARFDVHRYPGKTAPMVVDVQADLLSDLNTRVVVPLVPHAQAANEALPRLKPVLEIDGQAYILMTTDIAALPERSLGQCVANLEAHYREDIIGALDFLFQGF
ncbi:CcdB family protein [Eilatimonas milleporae]|uniref:Toxin CcdB n=1 Tax=Eilatimonas milleporae TaxID=911205 RepID=A0A3M0C4X6_9PROT|nr:CcdB family protein [Eilatimonas milleporae]RMB04874.1 toxin CcdB [Eilatimonas milleporae]